MRTGDFELCIVGGHERLDRPEVEMRHGQVYQLVLSNHGARQCDAAVKIDGKPVGIWRIPPQRQIVLEHPSDKTGKFTFFLVGTAEAEVTNIREDTSTGLVETIFTPEKEAPLPSAPAQVPRGASFLPARQSSVKKDIGGTGLSGKSEQQYGTAEAIEYDRANQVTVQVRLVPSDAHLSGLQPLGGSQPSASFPLPGQQQTSKPANRWPNPRGLAFLLGAAALLGIVILLLLSYGGNFTNPLLPTNPQTSDGTPSYSTTSVSQSAQVNAVASPKQTGEMPAVKAASAALTQVAIVWLLIFLVAKAFKKKTIGWTVTGTVSGILFILLGLGSVGDGPHAHNEAIKAAYLLAFIAFLPFSIVRAFTRRTWPWIICGSVSGLFCLMLLIPIIQSASLKNSAPIAQTAPVSTPLMPIGGSRIHETETTLNQINEAVYSILMKHGMPSTKQVAAILQEKLGAKELPVSVENIRELGGIQGTSRTWWDTNILNDSRFTLEERIKIRDGVNLCFSLAVELNRQGAKQVPLESVSPSP